MTSGKQGKYIAKYKAQGYISLEYILSEYADFETELREALEVFGLTLIKAKKKDEYGWNCLHKIVRINAGKNSAANTADTGRICKNPA